MKLSRILTSLSLLLISLPALANIENGFAVFQTSGYTPPEHAFRFSCVIGHDGALKSTLEKPKTENGQWSWYVAEQTQRNIDKNALKVMFDLLKTAAKTKAEKLPAACDDGTSTFQGVLEDVDVTLDSYLDCNAHYLNRSQAAIDLVEILKSECKTPR